MSLLRLRRSSAPSAPRGDMSLIDHLTELRKRLVISVAALAVGTVVGFFLWNPVLDLATDPYCKAQADRGVDTIAGASSCQLYITSPMELLTTRITVGVYIGLFIASPVVLWQLWRFITPGLHRNEKRYAVPFVLTSMLLFLLGATTAWLTFPRAISFFLEIGGDHVLTLFNPGPYLRLIFLMMLVFGVVFEIPLVLVFLQLAGVVSSRRLRSWRRQAIVANFAVAAIATPSQDPYSMMAMALPMCVFYEMAIVIGRLFRK